MRTGKRKFTRDDEGTFSPILIAWIVLIVATLIFLYMLPDTSYTNDGEFETIVFDDLGVYSYRGNIYVSPSSLLVDENDYKDTNGDYIMLVFNNDGTYKISIDGEEYRTVRVTSGFLSTRHETKILESEHPELFNQVGKVPLLDTGEITILETTHNIEETHDMEWVLR